MIFFNLKIVRDFLLNNGIVYTLRRKRRTGKDTVLVGSYYKHKKLAKVNITYVTQISSPDELKPYYRLSGFDSPESWFEIASKLHKNELPLHLYLVEVIPSNEFLK